MILKKITFFPKWSKNKINKISCSTFIDCSYVLFIILGFITLILIFYKIVASIFDNSNDNIAFYLSSFAILISAFIASISLMKSIQNSNKLANELKITTINKDVLQMHYLLIALHNEISSLIGTYESIKSVVNKFGTIEENYFLLDILKIDRNIVIERYNKLESSQFLLSLDSSERKNIAQMSIRFHMIDRSIKPFLILKEINKMNIKHVDKTVMQCYKDIIILINNTRRNAKITNPDLMIFDDIVEDFYTERDNLEKEM
jgi:hypothetical protein